MMTDGVTSSSMQIYPSLGKNNLLDFKSLDKDVELVADEGVEEYLTSDCNTVS